jgi:hypothetical protein
MAVGSQQHVPAALSPGKCACTHCRESWLGPRVGLYGMRMRKRLPRPGFETWTVPLVAIRCNTLFPTPYEMTTGANLFSEHNARTCIYDRCFMSDHTRQWPLYKRSRLKRDVRATYRLLSSAAPSVLARLKEHTMCSSIPCCVFERHKHTTWNGGMVCYSSSNAGQKKFTSYFLSNMSMRPTKKLKTWSRAKRATVNFTYRPSCSVNMENVVWLNHSHNDECHYL